MCTDDMDGVLAECRKRNNDGRMRAAVDVAGGHRLSAMTNYVAALCCAAADLRA